MKREEVRDRIAIIVLTDQALVTGEKIIASLNEAQANGLGLSFNLQIEQPELWFHQKCHVPENVGEAHFAYERLAVILPELWSKSSLLIFVMATGIVVRQIAPFLQGKAYDPAVLVLDENGQFVISLLSGHLGGANVWAKVIAEQIDAQPVITTATDIQGLISPDEYARRLRWMVKPVSGLKRVNRQLLDTGDLKVWSQISLPLEHPLRMDKHYDFVSEEDKDDAEIWITPFPIASPAAEKNGGTAERPWITLIPRVLSIGVGSRQGISKERILEAIQESLMKIGASEKSVFGVFSIDIKQEEVGMIEAACEMGVPFRTFSAAEIQTIIDQRELTRSEYVKEKIGVDGVCEAASLLGTSHGKLILSKQKRNGVTVAISMERFLS